MSRRRAGGVEVKVLDVCRVMEDLAPSSLAYSWDRVGLQTGNAEAPVSRLLVTLSVTDKVLEKARKSSVQMIVSHHPVIFRPPETLRADVAGNRIPLDLVRAGIACYAAHTNLDVSPGGVNDVLAGRLGLTQVGPLIGCPHARQVKLVSFVPESSLEKCREAVCEAGAGVIGEYTQCTFSCEGIGTFLPGTEASPFSGEPLQLCKEPERRFEVVVPQGRLGRVIAALQTAHPYEEVAYDLVPLESQDPQVSLGRRGTLEMPKRIDEFARQVRRDLKTGPLRVTGSKKRWVRSVAVLGGSGKGQVASLPKGIDVFVSGDLGYHDALDAEQRDMALVDAGHQETERPVLTVLADLIRDRLPDLDVMVVEGGEVFRLEGLGEQ